MELIKRMIGETKRNLGQGRSKKPESYQALLECQYKKLHCLLFSIMDRDSDDNRYSVFLAQMRECFFKWREVNRLQDQESQANLVLTGFYASEKIRSKFLDFVEYVTEDMEEETSSEELVMAGYNSCMNLARIDFKKIQDQTRRQQTDQGKISKQETLTGFLQMLAYKNSFFSKLYTVYLSGTKRKRGENIRETDQELYSLLKEVNKFISRYNDYPQPSLFAPILKELSLHKDKIAEDVAEADKIKTALAEILSDENMRLLSNKEEELETLKQHYRKIGELVKKFL